MNTQTAQASQNAIFNNPGYYYIYYDDRYASVIRSLKLLQQDKINPASMIQTRFLFANLAGKRAILATYMQTTKKEEYLQILWDKIEATKEILPKTYDGLKEYERLISQIIQDCKNA